MESSNKTVKNGFVKFCISLCILAAVIISAGAVYKQYQIYDFQKRYNEAPAGAFIETGKLNLPRSNHSDVRLNDGSVLIIGGNKGAELFNPKTGQYKLINKTLPKIHGSRINSILLPNGNVLIAGCYLFDAETKKFTLIKNINKYIKPSFLMFNNMCFLIPVLLDDKRVLVIVDNSSNHIENQILMYDIKNNSYENFDINLPDTHKKYLGRGFSYIKDGDIIYFISGAKLIKWNYKENKFIDAVLFDKFWQQAFVLDNENVLFNDGYTYKNSAVLNVKTGVLTPLEGFHRWLYQAFKINDDYYIFASSEREKLHAGEEESLYLLKCSIEDFSCKKYNTNEIFDYYRLSLHGFYGLAKLQSISRINENDFLVPGGQYAIPDDTRTRRSYIIKTGL